MNKDELAEDVHFIFEECGRFLKMIPGKMKDMSTEDAFSRLPRPSGRGDMICGIQAIRQLDKLARYAGRQAGIEGRVQLQTIRKPLGQILVKRFINERRDISAGEVERALSAAAARAKLKCSDRTHLIPCHLMWEQEPDELRIGPVLFRSRRSFRKMVLHHRRLLRPNENALKLDDRKWRRTLLFDALQYYRAFGWVAEVTIRNCDSTTSEDIAQQAVSSALDCLQMLLGARATDKMAIGGPRIVRDRRARIALTADERLAPTVSFGGPGGQVGFPKGWPAQLEREEVARIIDLCGVALEAAIDPDAVRPLSRRFLDAALWFGQAVREESPAAAVVKYVTAIERLLMTEEKDDISRVLAERLSAICALSFDPSAGSREQWHADTRAAYGLRSKLVHGSLSPRSRDVYRGVRIGTRLCEAALKAVLIY